MDLEALTKPVLERVFTTGRQAGRYAAELADLTKAAQQAIARHEVAQRYGPAILKRALKKQKQTHSSIDQEDQSSSTDAVDQLHRNLVFETARAKVEVDIVNYELKHATTQEKLARDLHKAAQREYDLLVMTLCKNGAKPRPSGRA
jgi:hypothetical protein